MFTFSSAEAWDLEDKEYLVNQKLSQSYQSLLAKYLYERFTMFILYTELYALGFQVLTVIEQRERVRKRR